MKVMGVNDDGSFMEYVVTPYDMAHEEAVLESWLEKNPESIVEGGSLLIIGRQVLTNLGGFIDLLALDRAGNVIVVELKRGRTPRDTLAQALEYASFARTLDGDSLEQILRTYLSDESVKIGHYHREYFQLSEDEVVVLNNDQHVVIVGQDVTREIRQTSTYLGEKGLSVTCVEFTFLQTEEGQKLLSSEIVVGPEPAKARVVTSGSLPTVNRETFLSSVDERGREVFSRILDHAAENGMPIHWGSKGFSVNADVDGTDVPMCYCYPPDSVYKQTIYTAFVGAGGLMKREHVPQATKDAVLKLTQQAEVFVPAGREFKCLVIGDRAEEQAKRLIGWIDDVRTTLVQSVGATAEEETNG